MSERLEDKGKEYREKEDGKTGQNVVRAHCKNSFPGKCRRRGHAKM